MKTRILMIAAALWLMLAASAHANPVSIDFWEAMQTPNSMHVQLTFYYGGPAEAEAPELHIRPSGGDELPIAAYNAIERNNGSGVGTHPTVQYCACDLAAGTVNFNAEFVAESGESFPDTVSVTVSDPPPSEAYNNDLDADDPQLDPESAMYEPGAEPDGSFPKGVDCIEWCNNPEAADGSGADDGNGGCAQTASGAALLLLLALISLATVRRVRVRS